MDTAMALVLEAADYRARELLAQALKYEALGHGKIVKETMDEHYTPLRDAIRVVRTREEATNATHQP